MAAQIIPDELYPFSAACRLIPSCRQGKRLNLRTLHRWRLSGRVVAVARESYGRRFWFLPGWQLQLLIDCPMPPAEPEADVMSDREYESVRKQLRAMGC